MSPTKKWFAFMTVFAFASVISFFQINGAYGDAHHFNGIIGWLGIGIVCGVVAIFGLYNVTKNAGGSQD